MNYGISLKWNTVTCFEMRFGGLSVVSDPCITDSDGTDADWTAVEKCDIVTVSHIHWDHITDLPELTKKFSPRVLVGELSAFPLLKWMDYNPSSVYPMTPDLELDFGDVKIRSLFGKHVDQHKNYSELMEAFKKSPLLQKDRELMDLQLLGSTEYRNYLFTARNGVKVLLWGNNPRIEQQQMLAELRPDIAIVQFTRHTPDEMADFVSAIGAKTVIPHHMDLHFREEEYLPKAEAFRDAFLRKVPYGRFIIPKHGEWMEM